MSPNQIKKLRERLGLTQERFAELVRADRVTLARWETGVHKPTGLYLTVLRELAAKSKRRKN